MELRIILDQHLLYDQEENLDIIFYANCDNVLHLKFENDDKERWDTSDWTIFFTVKENVSDLDSEAIISKTLPPPQTYDPKEGKVKLDFTSDECSNVGNFIYDLKIKTGRDHIYQIYQGMITFKKIVTLRTE